MSNDQLPPELKISNFLEGIGQYTIPPEQLMFKPYFFAFLDILGYKQLIDSLGADAPLKLYNILKDAQEGHSSLYESIRVKLHGDSVLIWSDGDSQIHFWNVLNVVMSVRQSFFKKELLLRGGISHGQNFIDKDIIVSPALISAYQLEQMATYPRILISEAVTRVASQNTSSDSIGQKYIFISGYARKIEIANIETDFDGLKIVKAFTENNGAHFLRTGLPSWYSPGDAPVTEEQSNIFKSEGVTEVETARNILLKMRPNSQDLRLQQKYNYMLGKFNEWVDILGPLVAGMKISLNT
jgi:hypothetical protein